MFALYTDYMLNAILFLKMPLGAVSANQPFNFRYAAAVGFHWSVM
jgi:hypothetical protein